MKKIFTLCASALFILSASATDPARGLDFDGTETAFIDLGANSLSDLRLSNPTALTVETWVKYNAIPAGCSNYIICNESSNNGGWMLRHETGLELNIGAPKADLSGNDWIKASSGVTPDADVWYHLAGVYDGTTLKFYINGAIAATTSLAGPMNAADQNLRIAEGAAWTNRRLNGSLSDLRVWSVAKTDTEILADMTNTLVGTEAGLVANWKMNECKEDLVADAAGSFGFTIPDVATVTWFGTAASGIKTVAAANVSASAIGNVLTITNNETSTLNYAIYSVAGVKAFEGSVKAGASIAQDVNLTGVFFVNGVTVNGETFNQKVIF